jgi:phosphoglucomutase
MKTAPKTVYIITWTIGGTKSGGPQYVRTKKGRWTIGSYALNGELWMEFVTEAQAKGYLANRENFGAISDEDYAQIRVEAHTR